MLLLLASLSFPAIAQSEPTAPAEAAPAAEVETEATEATEATESGSEAGAEATEAAEGWGGDDAAPTEVVVEEKPPPPPDAIIGEEVFPESIDAQIARRYRKLRLRVTEEDTAAGWAVRDGQGYVLTTHVFARLTNDPTAAVRLQEDREKGKRDSIIVASTGAALAASAILPLAFLEDVPEVDEDLYRLNPNDFENEAQFRAAQADANARLTLAQGAAKTTAGLNEDRRWTSLMLVSMGTLVLAVSPTPWELAINRQSELTHFYTKEEAQRRVDAYNRVVRARLGMPEPLPGEEEEIDQQTATELESALLFAPPPRGATLEPVLGLGFVGIRATF